MDIQRLVRFERSGRPTVLLDLNEDDATPGMFRKRDSFKYTPAQRRVAEATSDVEFRGTRLLGGAHGNAVVATTFAILDDDPSVAAQRVETFLNLCDEVQAQGREVFIEWRAENLAHSSFFKIQGAAAAQPNYLPRPWAGGPNMVEVEVTWPVEPAAYGHPMWLDERFDEVESGDRLEEWTLDTNGANVVVFGGLAAQANGQTIMRHTARGYKTADIVIEAKFKTPASFTGTFNIAVGKAIDPNNYVVAHVQETGAARSLEVRNIIGGASTTAATASPAALTTSTTYWLRFILSGNQYRAELWGMDPNLVQTATTPLTTIGPSTVSGAGTSVLLNPGQPIVRWQPVATSVASLLWLRSSSYAFRAVSPPNVVALNSVPGTVPATVDVDYHTPNNQQLQSAIYSWWPKPAAATTPIFGLKLAGDDDSGSRTGGLTLVANSNSPNGNALRMDTGPNTFGQVRWLFDLSSVEFGDDRDETLQVEGYALVQIDNTVTAAPSFIFGVGAWAGGTAQPTTYTGEFGATGKPVVIPANSSAEFRKYRLGTVTLPRWPQFDGQGYIHLGINSSTSTTGNIEIIGMVLVPLRSRAGTPTGKSSTDGTFPTFADATTDHRVKRVTSDLRGLVMFTNGTSIRHTVGLGGDHIQVKPGDSQFLVFTSPEVIDDAVNFTSTTSPVGTSGLEFRVWPRYRMWRPD